MHPTCFAEHAFLQQNPTAQCKRTVHTFMCASVSVKPHLLQTPEQIL